MSTDGGDVDYFALDDGPLVASTATPYLDYQAPSVSQRYPDVPNTVLRTSQRVPLPISSPSSIDQRYRIYVNNESTYAHKEISQENLSFLFLFEKWTVFFILFLLN